MGIGPGVLSLYATMRRDGLFNAVKQVVDIGAQVLVCNDQAQSVLNIFDAFGISPPEPAELIRLCRGASARELFERLGIEYSCIDASGEYFNAIMMMWTRIFAIHGVRSDDIIANLFPLTAYPSGAFLKATRQTVVSTARRPPGARRNR